MSKPHPMKILEFVQEVLIEEFNDIQRSMSHPYLSFSLIFQGIEFLGACLDSEPFSAKGLSASRFRKAIYELFPSSYHPFNQGTGKPFDLYEIFRCGLLHVVLLASRLELVGRDEKSQLHVDHLETKEIRGLDRLVLVLEDLSDDYENACKEIISRIRDGRLSGWKFMDNDF